MVSKGDRIEAPKTGAKGTVTAVSYRTTGNRSLRQVTVKWDGGGEWKILVRNVRKIS